MFKSSLILLLLLLVSILPARNADQQILEAFLRSQNFEQAKRFTQNFPGEGADYETLKSLVDLCQGNLEVMESFKSNWQGASYSLRVRSVEYLINCMSTLELDLAKLLEIKNLLGKNLESNLSFREFYLKHLFQLGELELLRQYSGPLDSVEIIDFFARGHSQENHRKTLIERLKGAPLMSRELAQKVLQVLIAMKEQKTAMNLFDNLRSGNQPWISDIYLYLGDVLDDSDLSVEGYRRKINSNPLEFEAYRGLASLYFANQQLQSGDEVLLKYLRRFPQKYKGAREIAQVLIDFGRFDELMMFVKNMRQQLKDQNAFMDVVLYAYSIKLQIKEFLGELRRIDPVMNPVNWARRIVDSFQIEHLQNVYQVFSESFSTSSMINLQLLTNMSLLSKVELEFWVDQQFAKFSSVEIEEEARRLLSGSHYGLVHRLLKASSERQGGLSEGEKEMFGEVLFRTGKYDQAYAYMSANAVYYKGDGRLYLNLVKICARSRIWRKNLTKWLPLLRASKYWKVLPQIERQLVEYVSLEHKIFSSSEIDLGLDNSSIKHLSNEQKIVIQLLEELLAGDSKTFESTLTRVKSFLNSELSAEKYPLLQFLYMVLLDVKSLQEEDFWTDLIAVLRSGMAGEFDELNTKLNQLELALKDHHAEILLLDLLQAHRCLVLQQYAFQEFNDQSFGERLDQWEIQVSKLFEQFPQSLYTPIAVEDLVSYFEIRGLNNRKDQWIRKYMLKFSSDLLAQKFRNKLL